MRNHIASIKLPLLFAGTFVLGMVASGQAGRLVSGLVSTAQADPGGPNKGGACHTSMMQGKWGYSYSGDFPGVGTFAGLGVETCNANGVCIGTDTISIVGDTITLGFTGNFSVNPDCTGSGQFHYTDGTVANSLFVLVDDGDELRFVAADPGSTLGGTAKRR